MPFHGDSWDNPKLSAALFWGRDREIQTELMAELRAMSEEIVKLRKEVKRLTEILDLASPYM